MARDARIGPARRLLAVALNLAVLCVLLLGSCAVPSAAYIQSASWFLEEVGPRTPTTFFVAFRPGGEPAPIQVARFDPGVPRAEARYHLPDGKHAFDWGPGEGSARVEARTEPQGSQLVRVAVAGDTPWTSVSEYRVADNRIQPLRHGMSAAWLLLAIPVLMYASLRLQRRIDRAIRGWLGVGPGRGGPAPTAGSRRSAGGTPPPPS